MCKRKTVFSSSRTFGIRLKPGVMGSSKQHSGFLHRQKKAPAIPAIHTIFAEPAGFRFLQKNGAPVLMGQGEPNPSRKSDKRFLVKFKVVTSSKLLYIW